MVSLSLTAASQKPKKKGIYMKNILHLSTVFAVSLVSFCTVMVDNPPALSDTNDHYSINNHPENQQATRKIEGFFPFEDNSNIWNYTESGGNTVTIIVTDTISDDGVTYFRVSFRENRVDTTDDWFLRSSNGIYFGQSLTGDYDLFLPVALNSVSGSFKSKGSIVAYDYYDSLIVNGMLFYNVLHLHYSNPIIHGFDDVTLVDLIGIVQLVDHNGRWPILYAIDSCRVGGDLKKF